MAGQFYFEGNSRFYEVVITVLALLPVAVPLHFSSHHYRDQWRALGFPDIFVTQQCLRRRFGYWSNPAHW